MNQKKDEPRDQPDAHPASGELDEQDLDGVAGGKIAKIDAFTIKQGIPSIESEAPIKGR